jgi:hypothetical protein
VKPASLNIIYNPFSPLLPASFHRRLMEFESGTIGRLGPEQEFELQIVADLRDKPQHDVETHLLCDPFSSQYTVLSRMHSHHPEWSRLKHLLRDRSAAYPGRCKLRFISSNTRETPRQDSEANLKPTGSVSVEVWGFEQLFDDKHSAVDSTSRCPRAGSTNITNWGQP